MDLEGCPEQISDKVFQDVHSALPGRRRGGGTGRNGEGLQGRVQAVRWVSSSQVRPSCEKAGLGKFSALFLACK